MTWLSKAKDAAKHDAPPRPHDDPPAKRRPEAYRGLAVTLGHMRAHGVRRLIYCSAGLYCLHSATVDADRWLDDMAVRGFYYIGPGL